jgi:phosphomevalonate kinase
MKDQVLKIKVPGKLFIAGEYAILEQGHSAVVIAVDRYMIGEISSSDYNELHLPQIGLNNIKWQVKGKKILFNIEDSKLSFVKNTLYTVIRFFKEKGIALRPFSLTVESELDDGEGKKYGLGSSAAIVVTVVTAMLHFFQDKKIQPTEELIYKLSAIAHYYTQGNGSCADIAASTFGGWLKYTMFDHSWLDHEINAGTNLIKLVDQKWPLLEIKRIPPPQDLYLVVGWTGKSVSTVPMVRSIQALRTNHFEVYQEFLSRSKYAVSRLIESFYENNSLRAVESLTDNRHALMHLGELATVDIETPELKKLISIANRYGSGKSSGAGGGDCGIAFVINKEHVAKLEKDWQQANIEPLKLNVSLTGVSVKTITKDHH